MPSVSRLDRRSSKKIVRSNQDDGARIDCEYSYDTIDDIDDAVKNYKRAGLYMFAKRYIKNGETMFKLSYIGETGDYSTRGYSNHHKRKQIEKSGANEFGLYLYSGTDAKRLEHEGDLIDTNNPPCNG